MSRPGETWAMRSRREKTIMRATNRKRLLGGIRAWVAVAVLAVAAPARGQTPSAEDEKYGKAFDAAIDNALEYLQKAQLKDGSFPGGIPRSTAVASLCVMAFLARGYSPEIPPHGDALNRSIDFVLASQGPSGTLIGGAGSMYAHNISTLMLSEVSGMVDSERQARVREALAKALRLTLAAQAVHKSETYEGGWRYGPDSNDSDISHSGWALLALRSARNNGAPVPEECISNAVKFIQRCRNADGGFAYQPGSGSGLGRTGVGLLSLELTGHHRDKTTLAAGEYILRCIKGRNPDPIFFYCTYYCAQGMFQLGDDEWRTFAPQLYDPLLKTQKPDGSWPVTLSQHKGEEMAGPCYSTAMAVLALSVSYRQLPIYQR